MRGFRALRDHLAADVEMPLRHEGGGRAGTVAQDRRPESRKRRVAAMLERGLSKDGAWKKSL